MKQSNNDKSFTDKLDHKHRNKSELVFYKLLAKQKLKANPFKEVKSDAYSLKDIKPGGNPNDPV